MATGGMKSSLKGAWASWETSFNGAPCTVTGTISPEMNLERGGGSDEHQL